MFETVAARPEDPIDVIARAFKVDGSPSKIDLGIGVYRDETGHCPVMRAIAEAEQRLLTRRTSKEYLTPAGNVSYCELVEPYLFGSTHKRNITSIQTPGGGPAIRVAAELIQRLSVSRRIWVPTPTWGHQLLVLRLAGLEILEYPYYDTGEKNLVFSQMLDTLEKESRAGDAVLLHGCCHNPTGADLTASQWQELVSLFQKKELIPFIDIAYQGLARGLEEDSLGVRLFSEALPEVLVASTSSKSFGIYRERAGMISLVSDLKGDKLNSLRKEMLEISRGLYFMPADHGAAMVVEVLGDAELTHIWKEELDTARLRIAEMRELLSNGLNALSGTQDYTYIKNQFGMFSLLPLDLEQIARLSQEYSVYLIPDGRANLAGLSPKSIPHVVQAIHAVRYDK
ncbi:MAG: aromatic amino acid transaminase [Desulfobacterium sp.]